MIINTYICNRILFTLESFWLWPHTLSAMGARPFGYSRKVAKHTSAPDGDHIYVRETMPPHPRNHPSVPTTYHVAYGEKTHIIILNHFESNFE